MSRRPRVWWAQVQVCCTGFGAWGWLCNFKQIGTLGGSTIYRNNFQKPPYQSWVYCNPFCTCLSLPKPKWCLLFVSTNETHCLVFVPCPANFVSGWWPWAICRRPCTPGGGRAAACSEAGGLKWPILGRVEGHGMTGPATGNLTWFGYGVAIFVNTTTVWVILGNVHFASQTLDPLWFGLAQWWPWRCILSQMKAKEKKKEFMQSQLLLGLKLSTTIWPAFRYPFRIVAGVHGTFSTCMFFHKPTLHIQSLSLCIGNILKHGATSKTTCAMWLHRHFRWVLRCFVLFRAWFPLKCGQPYAKFAAAKSGLLMAATLRWP